MYIIKKLKSIYFLHTHKISRTLFQIAENEIVKDGNKIERKYLVSSRTLKEVERTIICNKFLSIELNNIQPYIFFFRTYKDTIRAS